MHHSIVCLLACIQIFRGGTTLPIPLIPSFFPTCQTVRASTGTGQVHGLFSAQEAVRGNVLCWRILARDRLQTTAWKRKQLEGVICCILLQCSIIGWMAQWSRKDCSQQQDREVADSQNRRTPCSACSLLSTWQHPLGTVCHLNSWNTSRMCGRNTYKTSHRDVTTRYFFAIPLFIIFGEI